MALAIALGIGPVFQFGSVLEPGAQNLAARFTTPPTTQRMAAINSFFAAGRRDGWIQKCDGLGFFAAADSQAATRNWIADQYNGTLVSSPTFTVDRGYAGDGIASYINSGFAPSVASNPNFVQNSASLGIWSRTPGQEAATAASAGNTNNRIVPRNTSDVAVISINSGTANIANTDGSGLFMGCRADSANERLYRSGSLIGTAAVASVAPVNVPISFGAKVGGTPLYSSRELAFWIIASNLTDADNLSIYNAALAYLTSVGAA